MSRYPIVEEVRSYRLEYGKRFNYDLYRFLINTLLIIYSLAEATEVATTGKTH